VIGSFPEHNHFLLARAFSSKKTFPFKPFGWPELFSVVLFLFDEKQNEKDHKHHEKQDHDSITKNPKMQ
jgi:hypothetical protein